jgi:hypothetical protein
MSLADLSGALLGFSLTIFILSYVIGDNFLFRLATHIFVGTAAGYATIITLYNIVIPHLVFPLPDGNQGAMILAVSYLIPSVLLLMKLSSRLSQLGNPAVAILVGVGAAAAIGGATFGTIFPQTTASIHVFENGLINGLVILIGTLSTLLFFQFYTRTDEAQTKSAGALTRILRWSGKAFIAITFGALFAGVYIAAITALIERFMYLWIFIKGLISPV